MRRQVLRVKGCLAGSNTENLLKQGDMLLAINKEPVTCFQDVENACQALENCVDSDGKLKITICRQVSLCQMYMLLKPDRGIIILCLTCYYNYYFSSGLRSILACLV
jgi:hypothetical protein